MLIPNYLQPWKEEDNPGLTSLLSAHFLASPGGVEGEGMSLQASIFSSVKWVHRKELCKDHMIEGK